MRFTLTTAVLALASSVFAQTPGFDVISKPTDGESVPAGSTYLIDWEPSTSNASWNGAVTIDLIGGAVQKDQKVLSTIAKGVPSSAGEYSWAVDASLGSLAVYGIRITLESDPTVFQYSFPFTIKATTSSSSSSSSGSNTSPSESSTPSPSSTDVTTDSSETTTITTPSITSGPTGAGNLSTTGGPSRTHTTGTTGTSKPSPTGSTVDANPGAVVRASSFALFGGLALAMFAL
ncbi:Ser-Thr-rich glycosyl-phosphatidyl-inositol-anchored membrane family-domain-containing protein [Coniochaeta sp. 2T2.1]|nr:Ser-Thr-rich glycosyl-phosphatidyl-inositol-anchored membrane family-domain-containing protein [Coniochaeta sp. 2T2.1]